MPAPPVLAVRKPIVIGSPEVLKSRVAPVPFRWVKSPTVKICGPTELQTELVTPVVPIPASKKFPP